MESKKSAKERVMEKLNLAQDLKESKVKTSIESIEQVDGKFKANFSIRGLPVEKSKKETPDYYGPSYKDIPKIFNNWDELSQYAKEFFSKTDEEIIKLCKELK